MGAVATRLLRFHDSSPSRRSWNLLDQAITELRARSWMWDGDVLMSPSGKKVEHQTESELFRLARGESIGTVVAKSEKLPR